MSGKKDPSTSEDSEKIDYVLVHEVDNDKDKTEMRDNFLQFIKNEGLEIPKVKTENDLMLEYNLMYKVNIIFSFLIP